MKYYVEVLNGGTCYYSDPELKILHREDGPAVEYADGAKFWFINGQRHRDNGPAVEMADGSKFWYKHGEYHREDGPAFEEAGGYKLWYINGKLLTKAEVEAQKVICAGTLVEVNGVKYMLTPI